MSTHDSNQPADSATNPTQSSSARTRLVVLMLLLGLAIAALAYDWKVARPNSEEAYHKILAMSEQRNSQVGYELTTNEHVQEMLGKTPARTDEINGKMVEQYRWWGGFPGRSYKVYVEYDRGRQGQLLLNAAHLNELPPPPETREPGPDTGVDGADPLTDMGGPGFGGDPGAGAPGEGGGRRRSRPEGRPNDEGGNEAEGDNAAVDSAAEDSAPEGDAAAPSEPAANAPDETAAEESKPEPTTGAAETDSPAEATPKDASAADEPAAADEQ